MSALVFLLVVATSIWVFIDARSIGVRKGQIKGFFNMGPSGWAFATLLLWIVGFPGYLAKRSEYKRINSAGNVADPPPSPAVDLNDAITQVERLAQLRDKGIVSEEEFLAKKRELLKLQ